MTNTTLLRQKIDESGLKMQYIAEKLGMTPQGLYKKLKDESDWFFSQVMILKDLLHLSEEDVNKIFFALNVDFQPT